MPQSPPTLEQELASIAGSVDPGRNGRMAVRHWGWDGRGGATLEVTGGECGGLSRERVRQLCGRVKAGLEAVERAAPGHAADARADRTGAGSSAPRLDEALVCAADAAPTTSGALARRLADRHIASRPFHPAGLASAARILGRDATFTLETVKGVEIVIPHPDDPALDTRHLVATTIATAHSVVRRTGAARVADITGRVAGNLGAWVDEDFVCAVLSESDDFVWLDRRSGWFFLSSLAKNAVTARVLKVLSVAGELNVGGLHEGIRRDERMREFVMPEYVLAELCERIPGVAVEGRLVRTVEPLEPEAVLEATELAFVRLLRERRGPVERRELERLCLLGGMTTSSFNSRVAYSPIIEEVEQGRYALRGTTSTPPAAESETDQVPHPGDLDHFRSLRRR